MRDLLYVIVLNYNGGGFTVGAIKSALKSSYSNFRIMVVDNYSQDGSDMLIQETFPELEFIQTGRNAGFAGGNNIGIRYAIEQGAEYICLLNNDVEVEENCFSILVDYLKENGERIVGPAILYWDKEKVWSSGMHIDFYKGECPSIALDQDYSEIEKKPIECDYVSGCCLMFHKSTIEKIGYLPEEYYLYYEETDWCCNAKRHGIPSVCIPRAKLWHYGSACVSEYSGMKMYFEDRNRFLFEQRNASVKAKMFFYPYFFVQLFYRLLTGRRNLSAVKALIDGQRGIIKEEYTK